MLPGQPHALLWGLGAAEGESLVVLQGCSKDHLEAGREMSWDQRFQVTLDGVFPDQHSSSGRGPLVPGDPRQCLLLKLLRFWEFAFRDWCHTKLWGNMRG